MSNRPRSPLIVTVNVTGLCNLSCQYCFFQPRLEQPMRWDDFENVVGQLLRAEIFLMNISGGEPFTHPQIDRILELSHESFRHVVTLTNGTLLRERDFATIARIVDRKGSFPIQVSLDAVDSAINARTRSRTVPVIRRNLDRLAGIGANLVIAMVVSRDNVSSVESSIRELSTLTRHFHIMAVQPVPALRGADAHLKLSDVEEASVWRRLSLLRDELDLVCELPTDEVPTPGCAEGAPCMAGFTQVVIDPDLRVRPCDRLVDTYVGDLQRQSLLEVWDGPELRPVLHGALPYCRRERVPA